eukprot:GHVP01009545.1.p1 GENE.GHVP01009545.1~~GHVP01009545.1.p1  ORF type:complete len:307 (+),score=35.97 GHVP01009545.1:42-962(+)
MRTNRKLLAVSGVQAILDILQNKFVDFQCNDFSGGDFEARCLTNQIQILSWSQEKFLTNWKSWIKDQTGKKSSDFNFSYNNPDIKYQKEKSEFFVEKLSSMPLTFLQTFWDLPKSTTLLDILGKAENESWIVTFNFIAHSEHEFTAYHYPYKLIRGPFKKWIPVWKYYPSNALVPETSLHPNLNINFRQKILSIDVIMDENFANPHFHVVKYPVTDLAPINASIEEMCKVVERHASEKRPIFLVEDKEPKYINVIEGDFYLGLDIQRHHKCYLYYKTDFKGKDIYQRIIDVTPKGTSIHIPNVVNS